MDCVVHGVTKSRTRLSDFHLISYSSVCMSVILNALPHLFLYQPGASTPHPALLPGLLLPWVSQRVTHPLHPAAS